MPKVPMAGTAILLAAVLLHLAAGLDPDTLQDFCVAERIDLSGEKIRHPYGFSCKDPANVTVDDFVFVGVKVAGKFSLGGISVIPVGPTEFPGLNALGMSLVRADLAVGTINPPHLHPRATELAFVLEGKVYSGFVDSRGKAYAKVVEKGEVAVYPKGLVHFQMNVGEGSATILGSFNGQNPGLERIPQTVFGSGIRADLLEKAFGLTREDVAKLGRRFGSGQFT